MCRETELYSYDNLQRRLKRLEENYETYDRNLKRYVIIIQNAVN